MSEGAGVRPSAQGRHVEARGLLRKQRSEGLRNEEVHEKAGGGVYEEAAGACADGSLIVASRRKRRDKTD